MTFQIHRHRGYFRLGGDDILGYDVMTRYQYRDAERDNPPLNSSSTTKRVIPGYLNRTLLKGPVVTITLWLDIEFPMVAILSPTLQLYKMIITTKNTLPNTNRSDLAPFGPHHCHLGARIRLPLPLRLRLIAYIWARFHTIPFITGRRCSSGSSCCANCTPYT